MNNRYNINHYTVSIILGAFLLVSILSSHQQQSFSQNETSTSTQPISIKTENNAVGILVFWDSKLSPGTKIPFIIDFKHPFNDMNLQHVNYNLQLFDDKGTSIFSKENIHVHMGSDVQNIMIENPGKYTMLITVLGTGINPPFDTTRSGVAKISLQM